DELKKKFDPVVLKPQIAKPENIMKARKMMEGVILKGTGSHLKSEFVSLAGKTGTAKTNYANKGEYAKYNGSFCGYFPAEHPMYSMIVVIYDPKGVFYGGAVAGPVFKNVAEKVFALKTNQVRTLNDSLAVASNLPGTGYGYTKDFSEIYDFLELKYDNESKSDWAKVDPSETAMKIADKKIKKSIVPDVRGMGARDAVFLLENMGLKVKLDGVGKVQRQSIPPGAGTHGQNIVIYLN
ncbi:MAG TPA: penicillin-binding transpeptidase domain-containing protein, partial [Saprospiraceae bacterium]|nr:penicillin-binding transpeptidase domain-containing protein [Saprospiraceae bacterium]